MSKFKIGDKVRCVAGTEWVGLGETGTISKEGATNTWWVVWDDGAPTIQVSNKMWSIAEHRIELIEPEPAKFKIGDPVRCVAGDEYVQLGAEGVVTEISETNACYVEWSTLDKILQTDDNSWFVRPCQIELIEADQTGNDLISACPTKLPDELLKSMRDNILRKYTEDLGKFGLSRPDLEQIAPFIDTAKLARIERWAGLAMLGMVANVDSSGSYEQFAEWSFNYADAMEAEFQRRYNNNNNKTD